MRTGLKLSSVMLAVLLLAAVAPMSASADLLVNGSFEDGVAIPDTPGYLPLSGGDTTSITGWEVLGGAGAVDYIGSYWTDSNGVRSLDLGGSPGPGAIQQVVDGLTVGSKYWVFFDMAANPFQDGVYGQNNTKWLQVSAIGNSGTYWEQSQMYDFQAYGRSTTDMGWEMQNFHFEAWSDSVIIRIAMVSLWDATPEDMYCGPAIDNVAMYANPVPGAFLLGALGLGSSGGIFAWRKRKTR
jgi:choice-of-anchor C domain-containing protein